MAFQYTIYSFSNNETLSGLFNAVAGLMGGSTMKGLIAIVLFAGFFGTLFAMAFARDRMVGPKWIISVVLISSILLAPKATVQIIDIGATQSPKVIANVPWGLAALASLVSTVGRALTITFETSFQSVGGGEPDSLSYSKNGMLFGAKLIKNSREIQFTDTYFRANMTNFIKACTFYDVTQELIDPKAFASSDNLWALMGNTNAARFSFYSDATVTDTFPCPAAYAKLNALLIGSGGQDEQLTTKLGLNMFPRARDAAGGMDNARARGWIEASLPEGYQRAKIGAAAASAAAILRQNAIINAAGDAVKLEQQQSNDPAAMMLSLGREQAMAQMNAQFVQQMRFAEESLPMMRNNIEAIIYICFPLVILLAMLFGGMAAYQLLQKYALLLIWVSLWAPLYAAVNFLVSSEVNNAIAGSVFDGSVAAGMTINAAGSIYNTTLSKAGLAGSYLMSVPVIAGAIVFGMDKLMSVAAGSVATMDSATKTAATPAATGNFDQGNVNLDKLSLDAKTSSPFMNTTTNAVGTTTSDTATGDMRFQANTSKTPLSVGTLATTATSLTTASTDAKTLAQTQSSEAAKAYTQASVDTLSATKLRASGTQVGSGSQTSDEANVSAQAQKVKQVANQLGSEFGLSDNASARIALNAGLDGNAGLKALGNGVGITAGAQGQLASQTQLSAMLKRGQSLLEKEGITDAASTMEKYSKTEDFRRTARNEDGLSSSAGATYQQAASLKEASNESFAKSKAYSIAATNAETMQRSVGYDYSNDYVNFLNANGVKNMGALNATDHANYTQQWLSSGVLKQGENGAWRFQSFGDAGPANRNQAPLEAEQALRERTGVGSGGPLTVGGNAVTRDSLTGAHQANKAAITQQSGVSSQGLPTQASIEQKGADVVTNVNAQKAAAGKGVREASTELNKTVDRAIDDAPRSKLAFSDATEKTLAGLAPGAAPYGSQEQAAQKAQRKARDNNEALRKEYPSFKPPPATPAPGTPGPNPS